MNVNFIRCQKPSFHKTEGRKKCLEIYIPFFLPSHSDDHFLKITKINVKHVCLSRTAELTSGSKIKKAELTLLRHHGRIHGDVEFCLSGCYTCIPYIYMYNKINQ